MELIIDVGLNFCEKSGDGILMYCQTMLSGLNNFLDGQECYANAIILKTKFNGFFVIKINFSNNKGRTHVIYNKGANEIKLLKQKLSDKNIEINGELNYKTENDVYIIRPNGYKFTYEKAMEDAHNLVAEILTGN